MKKLNLDALREKAGETASAELLATINGGVENSCHTTTKDSGYPIGDFFEPYVPQR